MQKHRSGFCLTYIYVASQTLAEWHKLRACLLALCCWRNGSVKLMSLVVNNIRQLAVFYIRTTPGFSHAHSARRYRRTQRHQCLCFARIDKSSYLLLWWGWAPDCCRRTEGRPWRSVSSLWWWRGEGRWARMGWARSRCDYIPEADLVQTHRSSGWDPVVLQSWCPAPCLPGSIWLPVVCVRESVFFLL